MAEPDAPLMPRFLGPLPPVARMVDFLGQDDHAAILEWTLSNPDLFAPVGIHDNESEATVIDPTRRICAATRDFGPHRPMLRERLLAALPDLMAQAGMHFAVDSLELELAAHGDGAFFTAHTDIPVGAKRKPLAEMPGQDRILSAVYYFYARPKRFSGGNLRLYRFGAAPHGAGEDPANRIDIEPLDNVLIAFGSTVQHEVTRVSCPSGRFEDQRFAINCWYCTTR